MCSKGTVRWRHKVDGERTLSYRSSTHRTNYELVGEGGYPGDKGLLMGLFHNWNHERVFQTLKSENTVVMEPKTGSL
jgi:hypothetical protein